MSDLIGIIFEQCHLHLGVCEKHSGEKSPEFQAVNDRKYLEHDVYIIFDLLLSAGLDEFYIYDEPGKKKAGGGNKMFGKPQFENVCTKPTGVLANLSE